MKVTDLFESEPTVTYKQNGDGSWCAKIVTSTGGVKVHTRKTRAELEKIVKQYKR